jgi:hypothetical protein
MMISARSLRKAARLPLAFALLGAAIPADAATLFDSVGGYDDPTLAGNLVTTVGVTSATEYLTLINTIGTARPNLLEYVAQGAGGLLQPFSAKASIYSAGGNTPGALLFSQIVTFANPVRFAGGFNSFSAVLNAPQLDENAYYLGLSTARATPAVTIPLYSDLRINFTLLRLPDGRFDTSLNGVAGAAFRLSGVPVAAAIPEPATWAMLIFGFAAVGTCLRRRPRVQSLAHRIAA